MAEWLAVIAIIALFWAIVRGFQRGAQSAGHLYREAKTRLTKDAVAAGHGRFARSSGRNAGMAAAATVGGLRVIGAAVLRGMGEGWRHGWARGQARRAGTVDHDQTATRPGPTRPGPDPDPVAAKGTTVDSEPTGTRPADPGPDMGWLGADSPRGRQVTALGRCPWDVGGRCCGHRLSPARNARFCVPHEQRYRHEFGCQLPVAGDICGDYPASMTLHGLRCGPHYTPAAPADPPPPASNNSEPPKGTEPMTAPANTNTEVRTIRQLCDALKEIATTARAELDEAKAEQGRAATDMEDASAAKKRADAESQRMEGAQAHLGVMKLDAASLGEIAATHVACADEVSSSATRLAAADMRLSAAKKRVAGAEQRAAAADAAAANIWGRHGRHQQSAEESSVKVADGGAYNTP